MGARPCSPSITARQRPAGIFAALHALAAKAGGKSAKLILPCLALFFCLPSLRADVFGDFEFTDDGASITITDYNGYGGAVVIPDTINGKPVTSIGEYAFSWCSSLASVTIPNSVTSIGEDALSWCSNLASVTIPNSITSIGSGAFAGCTGLTSVTIPSSVTSIGESAFYSCSSLASVTIPNSITSIESGAFESCSGLTSVTIPDSVTSIGGRAFSGCTGLPSVTIPASVTYIGNEAFYSCDGLTSVTIPSSVTSIGEGVFHNSTNLSEIKVDPANTAYVDVEGILFDKLQTLLIAYPSKKEQTAYIIPSSVTSIGDSAFSSCSGLTSVTIPGSVTSIDYYAFEGCTGLTSVTIPSSVTSTAEAAFFGCTGLTSAIFQGNAPECGYDYDDPSHRSPGVFDGVAPGFTIYYQPSATGFTTPTWYGYPTKVLSPTPTVFSDSSFELPDVGANTFHAFIYNPTGTAWTFIGSSGVTGNKSGFTARNPVAPVGAQVAFVQKTGSISQAVLFTAGSYIISTQVAQRGYHQYQSQQVDVYVDEVKVGSFAPSSTAYTEVATSAFTVTEGVHMIKFVGLATLDGTLFIDDVVIIGP